MCGRYLFTMEPAELRELFELAELPADLKPRYNVAPTQLVPVVALKKEGQRRGMAMLRWGLVPPDASDPKRFLVNARSETVHRLPAFAESFEHRRCLMPATGFYEWKAVTTKKKVPYHFRLAGGLPFAFAALWSVWSEGKGRLHTCCSLTTTPNELVGQVHDRMPVILRPEDYAAWLDPDTTPAALRSLLRPYPADEMEATAVGSYVSNARNEGPECIEPAPTPAA